MCILIELHGNHRPGGFLLCADVIQALFPKLSEYESEIKVVLVSFPVSALMWKTSLL